MESEWPHRFNFLCKYKIPAVFSAHVLFSDSGFWSLVKVKGVKTLKTR